MTKECYNANETVSTNVTDITKCVYTVKTTILVHTTPYIDMSYMVLPYGTQGTNMTFELPHTIQNSTPPLEGLIRIRCMYEDNTVAYSDNLWVYHAAQAHNIYQVLTRPNGCPGMKRKIHVVSTGEFYESHHWRGVGVYIYFEDVLENLG